MKKTIKEALLLLSFFIGVYFLLLQVNWMQIMKIKERSDKIYSYIGDLMIDDLRNEQTEIINIEATQFFDSLKTRLCLANGMNPSDIKIFIFRDQEINAFALPGNNIYFNSGTLENASHPDEIAGILAHELAHIKKEHVTKGIIGKIGFSIMLSVITGGSDNILIGFFSELADANFSRSNEQEADDIALMTLQKAKIDPSYLATFFTKLNEKGESDSKFIQLLNTHPDSDKRAKEIKRKRKQSINYLPSYDLGQFECLKKQIQY